MKENTPSVRIIPFSCYSKSLSDLFYIFLCVVIFFCWKRMHNKIFLYDINKISSYVDFSWQFCLLFSVPETQSTVPSSEYTHKNNTRQAEVVAKPTAVTVSIPVDEPPQTDNTSPNQTRHIVIALFDHKVCYIILYYIILYYSMYCYCAVSSNGMYVWEHVKMIREEYSYFFEYHLFIFPYLHRYCVWRIMIVESRVRMRTSCRSYRGIA